MSFMPLRVNNPMNGLFRSDRNDSGVENASNIRINPERHFNAGR